MKKTISDAKRAAKAIKAVVLDGDGVIFPSQVFIALDEKGEYKPVYQRRDHKDGQGISLLRAVDGVRFAFITAETNGFAGALAGKLNRLPSVKSATNQNGWAPVDVFTGSIGKDKVGTIGKWLTEHNISWDNCAYMGDDVGDAEIMQKVGLSSAPSDAETVIKKLALFVAPRPGGNGAVRDLCNFILDAKGIDQTKLNLR
ncbi:MAG: HAD hydrolase family protein [Patescibacteria group bacterium]